jgi:hypothetical protein
MRLLMRMMNGRLMWLHRALLWLVLKWLRRCVCGRYVTRLVLVLLVLLLKLLLLLLVMLLRMTLVHKRWLTLWLRHTRPTAAAHTIGTTADVVAMHIAAAAAAGAHAFSFDFAFALHARLLAERGE